jgi:hypothetical protein
MRTQNRAIIFGRMISPFYLATSLALLGVSQLYGGGCRGTASVNTSTGGTASTNGGQSGGQTSGDDGGNGGSASEVGGDGAVASPSNPRPPGEVNVEWQPRMRARALLSGHSLMDNPLADSLEVIAAGRGRDYGWEQQIVIGSPLRARTRGDNPDASDFPGYSMGKNRSGSQKDMLRELASPTTIGANEHYDALVVTERHDILDVITWEKTVPYLRHYHDRLRTHEPSARTILYQSWWEIDKSNPQAWIDYQTKELVAWECIAAKVNQSLQADGLPQAVTVVPAGLVLARYVERALDGGVPGITGSSSARLDAIFADNVHMTPLGSYVMSAAVYAAIFAETPASATPPSDVDAAAAKAGAEIAWEVVSDYNRAGNEPWLRSLDQCRTMVSAMCPDYHTFRGRPVQCGDFWTAGESPFGWPDSSFPLPPP